VLVVDGLPDAAESLALLLALWGYEFRVAYDGPRALQVAKDYRPDVIFLDLALPGLSGFAVARRLRQDPAFETTLLVALTGYDADPALSSEAGLDLHLTKPVEPEVLRQLLADRHPVTR
jgi:CheY-like chemotaxis protein